MNTTLATTSQPSFGEMEKMALAIAKSGLFSMKTPEQAMGLMLASQAEGKHPLTILSEYDIIQGRPALKSTAALSRFQQAGGKSQWIKRSDDECTIEGSHPAGGTLQVTWTWKRATAAGLTSKNNWKQYPTAMLSARCVAEMVRAVHPACLAGSYLAEEVADFDTKPVALKIEKPVIKQEQEPETINAEIVDDEHKNCDDSCAHKELPSSPLTMLQSMMWSDEINDAHVVHFLVAKKVPNVTKTTPLKKVDTKVIERLIAKWDDVKAFKPIL